MMEYDGKYHSLHRAYYMQDEDKFFSCENFHGFPLNVDIYCEIPKLPEV